MTISLEHAAAAGGQPADVISEGWDLDVSIVEMGEAAAQLVRLTNDGCGTTCQSACSTTCP